MNDGTDPCKTVSNVFDLGVMFQCARQIPDVYCRRADIGGDPCVVSPVVTSHITDSSESALTDSQNTFNFSHYSYVFISFWPVRKICLSLQTVKSYVLHTLKFGCVK